MEPFADKHHKEAGQTEEARKVGINEAENKTNEQSTF
jgi:hypothetical protein